MAVQAQVDWEAQKNKTPKLPNVAENVGVYGGEAGEFDPSFLDPSKKSFLQGSSLLPGNFLESLKNMFESLKNMFSRGAENVGKGQVYTAQGLGGLGQNLGQNVGILPNAKPSYGGGVYGGESGEFDPDFVIPKGTSGVLGTSSDVDLGVQFEEPADATYGQSRKQWSTFGRNDPLWFNPDTDSVTVKDGVWTYTKGGGPTDMNALLPSLPDSTLPTIVEDAMGGDGLQYTDANTGNLEILKDEPGGGKWASAYQDIQRQLVDDSISTIDFPTVMDKDGNPISMYQEIQVPTQEFDPKTQLWTTVLKSSWQVDPRYDALITFAQNAQSQKNFAVQQKRTEATAEQNFLLGLLPLLTEPGTADVLGLLGGRGVDPLFQPVFGQGFGLPSTVQDTFVSPEQGGEVDMMSTLPATAQPAMQQRQYLPTDSYLQRIGPDAVKGLQGLMGFMGQTPYDLQRMVGSVTPQFSGVLPRGRTPAQTTGVR
jgi:hypothetical protein